MRSQVLDQLLLERAAGLYEQRAIDRLVRHPQRLILGVGNLQPPGDLLRRPVVSELRVHDAPQARVRDELTRLGAQRWMPGLPIRGLCSVGPGPPLRVTSRLIVEGARPRPQAIWRKEWPCTRPREISSRSAIVRADCERRRKGGWMPPLGLMWRIDR